MTNDSRPWTGGPWATRILKDQMGQPLGIVEDCTEAPERSGEGRTGDLIAKVVTSKAEANAHLIAQAPAMYEALEALIPAAQVAMATTQDERDRENIEDMITIARATLAAAHPTGQGGDSDAT